MKSCRLVIKGRHVVASERQYTSSVAQYVRRTVTCCGLEDGWVHTAQVCLVFECGHPIVFILEHLITRNSVNTTQNVNYVYSDMFRLA
jgi:hypothetical protein